MNLVAFSEKQIGEIGTVLAGDPSDEGFFHRVMMAENLSGDCENGLLGGEEIRDSFFAEGEHGEKLFVRKGAFFAGALDFDKLSRLGHDEIEIDGRVFVFEIIQVEHGFSLDNPDTDGGDKLFDGRLFELTLGLEFAHGEGDGDAGAGDGGGTGSPVGLENIAVDPEGSGAEGFEVDDRSE